MSDEGSRVETGMEKLIPIVNRLQDAFSLLGYVPIDLPQIAVVGCQSAGKSSVLENIVGRDFLPRGSGIVTRRPLVLQLHGLPEGSQEYAEFLHKGDKKFYDFAEVRKEIESETDRVCGSDKNLSSDPINLKVYSPHVLGLTLVDLPGVTKVPVGDQPADIGEQIRAMVLEHIGRPNCIILAVSPANIDIANSDAMQLAKEVDPEGERTIGVLTKVDLMDKGTDASAVLENEVYRLKLGWIAVVNRSQDDITKGKAIKYARQQEAQFFSNHPAYGKLTDRLGTPFLTKRLAQVLVRRIRDSLPQIQNELTNLLQQKHEELEGMEVISDVGQKRKFLLQVLVSFVDRFKELLEGRSEDADYTSELRGGARVEYIFREIFTPALEDIDVLDGISPNDVNTLIKNVGALGGSLFIPDATFESIIRHNVRRLLDPSLQCVNLVYDELVRMVGYLTQNDIGRFEALREDILTVVTTFLTDLLVRVNEKTKALIESECQRVNTDHPMFIARRDKINQLRWQIETEMKRKSQLTNNKRKDTEETPVKTVKSKHGYVLKKGGKGMSVWQKRWLSLKGQVLQYFKTNADEVPNGKISLSGCEVERADGVTGKTFSFVVRHPEGLIKKEYYFSCEKEHEFNAWMENIQRAINGEELKNEEEGKEKEVDLGKPTNIAKKKALSNIEEMDAEIICRILNSYFDIVRKTIQDQIPKFITLFLISECKKGLHSTLMERLYTEERIAGLTENEGAIQKRKKLADTVQLLEEAQSIMDEIRMESTML